MQRNGEPAARLDGGDGSLAVSPGEQVLLVTGSMGDPLEHLPDEAFGNVLLLSVRSPVRLERAIVERGLDPASVGVVPVSGSPVEYDGPMWVTDPVAPNDLTGISMAFARGMRYVADGEGWVAVDNLGTLLMYASAERLYRLMSHVVGQCRERRVRGVYAISGASVSEQTVARFRGLCDRVEDRS